MSSTEIQVESENGKILNIDLANEDLSWEVVETDDREMGVERLHEAILEYNDKDTDEPIVITLHVWEYPEGVSNMEDIEIEGGELIHDCYLGQFVLDYE